MYLYISMLKTTSSRVRRGTERVDTRSDGRKQIRNSADGCGEDRILAGS